MIKSIKKIIIDLDDTLFNTSVDAKVAYDKFLQNHSFNCTFDELYNSLEDVDYMDNPTIEDLYLFLKKYFGENFSREDFQEFKDIYINEVNLLNANTAKVLEYLSSKYELIVLTNWFYELQVGKLKKLHLDKYFSKIYCVDTIGRKPELSVMKIACEPYSFDECAIVGDSIMSDILVPKKYGLKAIYFGENKDLECISDLTELMKIF